MGKILVVDDEPAIPKLVAMVLSARGHEVLTAPDGSKAEILVRDHRPDLVISDVKMPLVDGFDLVRGVQRDFPGTQCILMSGGTDFRDATVVKQLQGLEICATLKKPFDVGELLKAVEGALKASNAAPSAAGQSACSVVRMP